MHLTPAHAHLLLNHFPSVGFSVGIGLFIGSLLARSRDLERASLLVFVAMALLTFPAYITGNAAQAEIQGTPGVSSALIDIHEGAALLAFVFMQITGAVAWFALWQLRRVSRVSRGSLFAILLLSVVTMGLVARAAAMGGDIRHPEIRAAADTTAREGSLARTVGTFVNDTPWVWPTAETLHFIGLSLLIGVVLLFNLRILGPIRNVPTAALDRLLPWAIWGFGLNLVTGMLFFVAKPTQYTGNVAFYWKVALVVLAGANAVYFTVFDKTWSLEPGADAPPMSKVVAASAMCLWVGVMYFGSMLPFIGNAF
jgi:uncharacterized membrane protein